MTYTPLEQKLREELLIFPELVALVGSNVFNEQLPQGLLSSASPARALTVKRVSTLRYYTHDGATNVLCAVRMQFTGFSNLASATVDVLQINKALVDFLDAFCATSTALFGSPATTPTQFPNIDLNEFTTPYPQTQPPLWQGIVDARIFNREDF